MPQPNQGAKEKGPKDKGSKEDKSKGAKDKPPKVEGHKDEAVNKPAQGGKGVMYYLKCGCCGGGKKEDKKEANEQPMKAAKGAKTESLNPVDQALETKSKRSKSQSAKSKTPEPQTSDPKLAKSQKSDSKLQKSDSKSQKSDSKSQKSDSKSQKLDSKISTPKKSDPKISKPQKSDPKISKSQKSDSKIPTTKKSDSKIRKKSDPKIQKSDPKIQKSDTKIPKSKSSNPKIVKSRKSNPKLLDQQPSDPKILQNQLQGSQSNQQSAGKRLTPFTNEVPASPVARIDLTDRLKSVDNESIRNKTGYILTGPALKQVADRLVSSFSEQFSPNVNKKKVKTIQNGLLPLTHKAPADSPNVKITEITDRPNAAPMFTESLQKDNFQPTAAAMTESNLTQSRKSLGYISQADSMSNSAVIEEITPTSVAETERAPVETIPKGINGEKEVFTPTLASVTEKSPAYVPETIPKDITGEKEVFTPTLASVTEKSPGYIPETIPKGVTGEKEVFTPTLASVTEKSPGYVPEAIPKGVKGEKEVFAPTLASVTEKSPRRKSVPTAEYNNVGEKEVITPTTTKETERLPDQFYIQDANGKKTLLIQPAFGPLIEQNSFQSYDSFKTPTDSRSNQNMLSENSLSKFINEQKEVSLQNVSVTENASSNKISETAPRDIGGTAPRDIGGRRESFGGRRESFTPTFAPVTEKSVASSLEGGAMSGAEMQRDDNNKVANLATGNLNQDPNTLVNRSVFSNVKDSIELIKNEYNYASKSVFSNVKDSIELMKHSRRNIDSEPMNNNEKAVLPKPQAGKMRAETSEDSIKMRTVPNAELGLKSLCGEDPLIRSGIATQTERPKFGPPADRNNRPGSKVPQTNRFQVKVVKDTLKTPVSETRKNVADKATYMSLPAVNVGEPDEYMTEQSSSPKKSTSKVSFCEKSPDKCDAGTGNDSDGVTFTYSASQEVVDNDGNVIEFSSSSEIYLSPNESNSEQSRSFPPKKSRSKVTFFESPVSHSRSASRSSSRSNKKIRNKHVSHSQSPKAKRSGGHHSHNTGRSHSNSSSQRSDSGNSSYEEANLGAESPSDTLVNPKRSKSSQLISSSSERIIISRPQRRKSISIIPKSSNECNRQSSRSKTSSHGRSGSSTSLPKHTRNRRRCSKCRSPVRHKRSKSLETLDRKRSSYKLESSKRSDEAQGYCKNKSPRCDKNGRESRTKRRRSTSSLPRKSTSRSSGSPNSCRSDCKRRRSRNNSPRCNRCCRRRSSSPCERKRKTRSRSDHSATSIVLSNESLIDLSEFGSDLLVTKSLDRIVLSKPSLFGRRSASSSEEITVTKTTTQEIIVERPARLQPMQSGWERPEKLQRTESSGERHPRDSSEERPKKQSHREHRASSPSSSTASSSSERLAVSSPSED